MKFIDLENENKIAVKNCKAGFAAIESSGKYLLGDKLKQFENDFANDQNVSYAIGVKNATDALYMSFKALNAKDRSVIVPNFGAYPTIIAAMQADAGTIIVAPVDNSLTICLDEISIPNNSIIVPVHLFGNKANIENIHNNVLGKNCDIIEDCAQSTGLVKSQHSIIAIHSFYPTKPLGSRGDGGAILTNDKTLFTYFKKARFYGTNEHGLIDSWGFNSRLDEWQSCFLSSKIQYYRKMNKIRQDHATSFRKFLDFGIDYSSDCVYHQYVTFWNNRERVIKKFNDHNIPTIIHYPKMIYDMPHISKYISRYNKQNISEHILSLPVGPHLNNDNVKKICNVLEELKNDAIRFEEIS